MIVKRGIAFRDGLQFVVEVDDDFCQGHVVIQFHTVARHIFLFDQFAALAQAKGHDVADIVCAGDNRGADIGLLDTVYLGGIGHSGGIVHLAQGAVLVKDVIAHVGHRGDDVHIELAVQTLLHNLHVEQAQKAAAETEAQGHGGFWLKGERCIVELQLFQAGAQLFEVLGLDGIDAGKDHGLHLLKPLDSFVAGGGHCGNRVAHFHFGGCLYAADDVTHIAAVQGLPRRKVHLEHTYLVSIVFLFRIDEEHLFALSDGAVHDFEISDNSAEGIKHAVENQGLQGCVLIALWRGDALHDGLQDFIDSLAGLAGGPDDFFALAPQQFDDFVLDFLGHGVGHVAFIEHGDDFQIVLDGHVEVRDGLCLHALCGVHHQQAALAGCDASRHLVGEVHVSRRVD